MLSIRPLLIALVGVAGSALMACAAEAPSAPAPLDGTWGLIRLDGDPNGNPVFVTIAGDHVKTSGCGRFGGTFTDGQTGSLKPLDLVRPCDEQYLAASRRVFHLLLSNPRFVRTGDTLRVEVPADGSAEFKRLVEAGD